MLLWLVPMAALTLMLGWAHPLTDELVLYQSRADDLWRGICRLTLCLPGAVTHYGWLTAGQMMDGLALGESTPDR